MMIDQDYCVIMARYNAWQNKQLIDFVNGLTEAANTVSLGGLITQDTRLYDGSYEYLFLETSSGFLGIGTTDPSYTLEVAGSVNTSSLFLAGVAVTSTANEINYLDGATVVNGGLVFGNGTYMTQDASDLFFDTGTTRLGIGTSAPSVALDVVGDINTSTTIRIDGIDIETVFNIIQVENQKTYFI